MARALLLALTALLTALLAAPGCRALSCYRCSDLLRVETDSDSSVTNLFSGVLNTFSDAVGLPSCADSRFQVASCPLNGVCFKTTIGGGTTRGCLPVSQEDGCTETGQETHCVCTSDYCNSAGVTAPALLLLLPAALLTLLISRW